MRFMLCARDRVSGAMTLVDDRSFTSRGDAVEAISGVRDFSSFEGTDIFLVDLDAAIPVAVVPWHPGMGETDTVAEQPQAAAEIEPCEEPTDEIEEPQKRATLGIVEIDIDAWSCEDCIYISTCAKSGELRPADCGSFQWRA